MIWRSRTWLNLWSKEYEKVSKIQISYSFDSKLLFPVPRGLTNPRCSASGTPLSYGSNQLMQYAGLGKINFYWLSSNYFFSEGSMRYLKVKPFSSVAFIVCTSREHRWPYRNPTQPYTQGEECKQITSGDFSYDLGDLCQQYDSLLDCPPLYFSVQAQSFADANQVACTDAACATPIEAQYIIMMNNLDCPNGSKKWLLSGLLIMLSLLVFKFL